MRYAVELGELSAAVERVAGALRLRGLGTARRLEALARAVPGGATAAALPGITERWRVTETAVWEGVAAHAGHLEQALDRYVQVESEVVAGLEAPS